MIAVEVRIRGWTGALGRVQTGASERRRSAGIGFTVLYNGFAAAEIPPDCRRSATGWTRRGREW